MKNLGVEEMIETGDVYIANMTQRFWCENNKESFSIYEKLRS